MLPDCVYHGIWSSRANICVYCGSQEFTWMCIPGSNVQSLSHKWESFTSECVIICFSNFFGLKWVASLHPSTGNSEIGRNIGLECPQLKPCTLWCHRFPGLPVKLAGIHSMMFAANYTFIDRLVGGLEPWNLMTFQKQLGMSSSQLTNSYFSEG